MSISLVIFDINTNYAYTYTMQLSVRGFDAYGHENEIVYGLLFKLTILVSIY